MPTRPLQTGYGDDLKLLPGMWHKLGAALACVLLLVFPLVVDAYWLSIGNLALVTIVGAVGLMILTGFAGQVSLGHGAFLAIGAYTAAILGTRYGLPYWLILPLAGGLAAMVGMAVGPFALRLEGLYLAIATIGLLELVRHSLLRLPKLTGGVSGLAAPIHGWFAKPGAVLLTPFSAKWEFGPFELVFEQKLYLMFLVVALISVWLAKNLQRSSIGRAMMAVRDHDLAASAIGVNPAQVKIIAFAVSSFFGGVAGAMYGFLLQMVTVEPFNLLMSVEYIAMVVVGGVGTVFGAVAGALVFAFLRPFAEMVGPHIPYFQTLNKAHQSTMLFSVVVCAFMVFEPLGVFGIWLRIKRYFMAWPFKH